MPIRNKNADPCTATGCLWPKTGGFVYVPVEISPEYCKQRWYLTPENSSEMWCWSYVGRVGGKQSISLLRYGCLYLKTIQHEVLHALGFHHEQVRSDRDSYVRILTQNIQPGMESNFNKVATNNLGTLYDFNSVMQYGNTAFSKNGLPTILSKANPNLVFGNAVSMSANDIARVKKLYKC
ncbi:high choriolytic enzyme 1-like [Xenentodon cancila]